MEAKTVPPFEINRVQKGEYRIYLNLTLLGDKAFEILQLAASLGFDKPEFVTDPTYSGGALDGHVFAILFREFHQYEDDPDILFAHLDEKQYQLWEACEPDACLKLTISSRFAKRLEAVA